MDSESAGFSAVYEAALGLTNLQAKLPQRSVLGPLKNAGIGYFRDLVLFH